MSLVIGGRGWQSPLNPPLRSRRRWSRRDRDEDRDEDRGLSWFLASCIPNLICSNSTNLTRMWDCVQVENSELYFFGLLNVENPFKFIHQVSPDFRKQKKWHIVKNFSCPPSFIQDMRRKSSCRLKGKQMLILPSRGWAFHLLLNIIRVWSFFKEIKNHGQRNKALNHSGMLEFNS